MNSGYLYCGKTNSNTSYVNILENNCKFKIKTCKNYKNIFIAMH